MSDALIGAIGSVVGAGGQIATNAQNANINRSNLAWQSAEADKSRQFNRQEAQIARQYNSIGAVTNRMLSAGYNPDLMYNMATGLQTGQQATGGMASAPSSIPMDNPLSAAIMSNVMSGLSTDVARQSMQTQKDLAESQENLNNAKAEESKKNAGLIEEYISNQPSVRATLDAGVHLSEAQAEQARQNASYIQKSIDEIEPRIEEMRQHTALMSEQEQREFVANLFAWDYWQSTIDKINSEIENLDASSEYARALKSLTDTQRNQLIQSFAYELLGLRAQYGDPNFNGSPLDDKAPESIIKAYWKQIDTGNISLGVNARIDEDTESFNSTSHSGPMGWLGWTFQNIVGPLSNIAFMFMLLRSGGRGFGGIGKGSKGNGINNPSGVTGNAKFVPGLNAKQMSAVAHFDSKSGQIFKLDMNKVRQLDVKDRNNLYKALYDQYPNGFRVDVKTGNVIPQ